MSAPIVDLRRFIRDVPDFPAPGILFRDITPLLGTAAALCASVERMHDAIGDEPIDKVLGIESRGFMFGAPLALRLDAGFVPARKPGKLPSATIGQRYQLEYGEAGLEIHADAVRPRERTLIVDDVIATGGTMSAAVSLVERLGGEVVACVVLVELVALGGRAALGDVPLHAVLTY